MKTIDTIYELITIPLTDKTVLDIGCGTGSLTRWLTKQGARAIGLECESQTVQKIVAAPKQGQEQYVMGVGQQLPIRNQWANGVIFAYSLHHIPSAAMQTALREAHRVLQLSGHLLIIEPIAIGPMFAVRRLIDDETTVRALAYQALQQMTGFEPLAERRYRNDTLYADFEAFVEATSTVDPARRQIIHANEAAIREQFYQQGQPVDGGYHFETQIRVNWFRKSA